MPEAHLTVSNATAGAIEPRRSSRVLDPISRISEILFGLIMALTFTSTLSAATADREEVRLILFGAIGCNIAWGLVDAVMYLINSLVERGRDLQMVLAVRRAPDPAQGTGIIADAVSPVMAAVLQPIELQRVRQAILEMRDVPPRPTLNGQDWRGALAVFLLVFLSTFPVVLPFLVFDRLHIAMRVSDGIAMAMLFASGFLLARHGGYHPWRTGISMVLLGVALVALAVALGG